MPSETLGSRINREAAHLRLASVLAPSVPHELTSKDHSLHESVHISLSYPRAHERNVAVLASNPAALPELTVLSSPFLHDLTAFERHVENAPYELAPPNLHHALALGKHAKKLSLGDGALLYAVRNPDVSSTLSSTHFFDFQTNKVGEISYNPSTSREPVHGTFSDHPAARALIQAFYDGHLSTR